MVKLAKSQRLLVNSPDLGKINPCKYHQAVRSCKSYSSHRQVSHGPLLTARSLKACHVLRYLGRFPTLGRCYVQSYSSAGNVFWATTYWLKHLKTMRKPWRTMLCVCLWGYSLTKERGIGSNLFIHFTFGYQLNGHMPTPSHGHFTSMGLVTRPQLQWSPWFNQCQACNTMKLYCKRLGVFFIPAWTGCC